MSVEPGIVDANILIYALDADAPQHLACRTLLSIQPLCEAIPEAGVQGYSTGGVIRRWLETPFVYSATVAP
jgi:hypothetical protein